MSSSKDYSGRLRCRALTARQKSDSKRRRMRTAARVASISTSAQSTGSPAATGRFSTVP